MIQVTKRLSLDPNIIREISINRAKKINIWELKIRLYSDRW
jgi:hypothetical protein